MALTRRERVIQALRHQQTDIVPYHIDLTGQAEERLAAFTGAPDYLAGTGIHRFRRVLEPLGGG